MVAIEQIDGLTLSQATRRVDISANSFRRFVAAGLVGYTQTPLGKVYQTADVERMARERTETKGLVDA